MQQHGSKHFDPPTHPPPATHTHTRSRGRVNRSNRWTKGVESKGQNSTFSEHGHLAYQIKGNHECSSIVANILLADPYKPTPIPLTLSLGSGSKGQNSTFSDHGHVSYDEIKENLECSNMVANMMSLPPPPPPILGIGSMGQNSTFSQHDNVAYQIN